MGKFSEVRLAFCNLYSSDLMTSVMFLDMEDNDEDGDEDEITDEEQIGGGDDEDDLVAKIASTHL